MPNIKIPTEFKLEDWLPQEPNQGPPLPEFLKIFWPWYKPEVPPGAEFRVSNLVISPTEVVVGETVIISCTVENTGSESGSYTVTLGGDLMAEQTVTLQPGESKTVSFEVTPTVAKTYHVSVDGLSGSFVATVPVANLYGVVTDAATGLPIEGVWVTATGPTTYTETHTGPDGSYLFENLEIGGYHIVFSHKDYEPRPHIDITLHEGDNTLNATLTPKGVADIRLENLRIEPTECYVGDRVLISVTAVNRGTASGSKTITCNVT